VIKLKEGVKIAGMRCELMFGLYVAASVYKTHGYDLTVTSLCDGKHSRTSLHYSGAAADLRIWDIAPEKLVLIVDEMGKALGVDYDVVLESDHIHLEFQPKGPNRPAR
jgi:uncharacterized protein YcbK (DUF882 family)